MNYSMLLEFFDDNDIRILLRYFFSTPSERDIFILTNVVILQIWEKVLHTTLLPHRWNYIKSHQFTYYIF